MRQKSDEIGPSVLAIMRADLSYEDVRRALWDADFDDEGRDTVYVRKGFPLYGDVEAVLTQSYGSIAGQWGQSAAFAPFEHAFPAGTQVASFSIKSKPRKPKSTPSAPSMGDFETGSGNSWSCDWSPTMNNDWHDDVLCTNGAERERPYLLANDSYVTQDEIMRAAEEHERQLNGN